MSKVVYFKSSHTYVSKIIDEVGNILFDKIIETLSLHFNIDKKVKMLDRGGGYYFTVYLLDKKLNIMFYLFRTKQWRYRICTYVGLDDKNITININKDLPIYEFDYIEELYKENIDQIVNTILENPTLSNEIRKIKISKIKDKLNEI